MDNNLLGILQSLFSRQNGQGFNMQNLFGSQNAQNYNSQQPNPYYPSEAYPAGQPQQNAQDLSGLLSMIMSALGKGGDNPLAALFKTQTKNSSQSDEHEMPKDEIIL